MIRVHFSKEKLIMFIFYSGYTRKGSELLWCIRRHFKFLLPKLSIKRLYNSVLCVFEMLLRKPNCRSHPIYIRVDVSPFCNLTCVGCKLMRESNARKNDKSMMSFQLFIKSLEPFVKHALKVNLYDEGEPLLNKEICRMVEYLTKNNVSSCISSNFSLEMNKEFLKDLVKAGLTHLIVAVDGTNQELYEKYRRGGSLKLVLSNIEWILNIKKKIRTKNPFVELQYIDFDDDLSEREKIISISKSIGVDQCTIIQGSSRKGAVETDLNCTTTERLKRGCYQLWATATINCRGNLFACDYGEDYGFSPIGLSSDYVSNGLRNHESIYSLRSSFSKNSESLEELCHRCNLTIR